LLELFCGASWVGANVTEMYTLLDNHLLP